MKRIFQENQPSENILLFVIFQSFHEKKHESSNSIWSTKGKTYVILRYVMLCYETRLKKNNKMIYIKSRMKINLLYWWRNM
jgi:hypothetical protein